MQLPDGWTATTLGSVADWSSGGTPSRKRAEYFGGDIPWVKTGELTEKYVRKTTEMLTELGVKNSSAKIFPKGSVGIAMYGATIGKVSIWGIDASTNQACAVARPTRDVVSAEFLYHFLRSEKGALVREGKGGAQPNISQGLLKAWPIALPPLNEQHRIVARIEYLSDEIDHGVESLRDAKRAIALYRQSLLKSAFEGRLTATWRAANPDKLDEPDALLERIREKRESLYEAALGQWRRDVAAWEANRKIVRKPRRPKRLAMAQVSDPGSLRELPNGWFYIPLESLVSRIRNGIPVKPDGAGPLKIFRISAVRPMAFDLDDFRHITDADGGMAEYRLRHGDLVFTRYNGSRDYVGVSAMYRGDGSHVYPDKLIRCQIDSDIVNPAYLEAATNCGESRRHIEGRIRTTAGQSGVSGNDIKSTPIPVCSPGEQEEIVRIVGTGLEAADELLAEVDANLARAEALRQSILKQAFSGELVPQDPNDEPAQALLARIRAGQEWDTTAKPRTPARRRGRSATRP